MNPKVVLVNTKSDTEGPKSDEKLVDQNTSFENFQAPPFQGLRKARMRPLKESDFPVE